MKSYRELADKVFERRDKYFVARKRKRKKIIKRASATLCALVVVLGISAWHLDWFKSDAPTVNTQTNPLYDAPNGGYTMTLLETPTTATTAPITAATTKVPFITQPTTHESATTTTLAQAFPSNAYCVAWDSYGINWDEDNDIVHVVLADGQYLAINSKTGKKLRSACLAGNTKKIKVVNDELWISYTELTKIDVYDKDTFTFKRQVDVGSTIFTFDVYENYLIYSVRDQHSDIYRYDLNTKETARFLSVHGSFCEADILVDAEKGTVYMGESRSTGSAIYHYDIETMERISYYRKKGTLDVEYGVSNGIRRMYLVGNQVHWAAMVLDADNVSNVLYDYRKGNWCGTVFANDYFTVIYGNGANRTFYDTRTHKYMFAQDSPGFGDGVLITESGNLVYTAGKDGQKYIVVIPDWLSENYGL